MASIGHPTTQDRASHYGSSRWLDLATRLVLSVAIAAALIVAALSAAAQDASWLPNPDSEDYQAIANWDASRATGSTAVSAAIGNNVNLEFQDASSASSATTGSSSDNDPRFFDSCSTGSAIVVNRGFLRFFSRSTAGSASLVTKNFSTTPARTVGRPS